jgi:2'-hydroxyisoflavone reductase
MDLLILGGTVFLGRALVEAAQARGHHLTLFNRGKTNPELFHDVEQVHGDRATDLSALAGRRWDAAIDTCGYVPRVVRMAAESMAEQVEHYTFISSLSVYADASWPGMDESAPVGVLADESVEKVDGDTYGPLKALCEQAVERALPGRTLVIRPGLIVGPFDPSDRFTYWPVRVAQGGEVLAPGSPHSPVQFIDVRDLAEWTIAMVEQRRTGIYNAVGPERALGMGELLETSRSASGSEASFTWVDESFILAQGVEPWSDLPVWIPVSDASSAGFHQFDRSKAIADGLRFRPLAETVRATLEWEATRPAGHAWRAGITREKEAELLELWKKQKAGALE